MSTKNRENRIREKLEQALHPQHLSVLNESHRHKGHAGDDGTGETHFHIEVISDSLSGLNRVACQRMIYSLLQEEFDSGLHALSLKASAKI